MPALTLESLSLGQKWPLVCPEPLATCLSSPPSLLRHPALLVFQSSFLGVSNMILRNEHGLKTFAGARLHCLTRGAHLLIQMCPFFPKYCTHFGKYHGDSSKSECWSEVTNFQLQVLGNQSIAWRLVSGADHMLRSC